jgi:hypothetical protein
MRVPVNAGAVLPSRILRQWPPAAPANEGVFDFLQLNMAAHRAIPSMASKAHLGVTMAWMTIGYQIFKFLE